VDSLSVLEWVNSITQYSMNRFWTVVAFGLLLAGCASQDTLVNSAPVAVPDKGCTDMKAVNFDIMAEVDDGTCRYDEVVAEYFCSVRDLAAVRIGMDKFEVKNKLGVFPNDILGSDQGCEIHVYQVRTAAQEMPSKDLESNQVANEGFRVFRGESRAYRLFFRSGRLESILSERSAGGLPHELACLANNMASVCSSDEDYIVCTGCTDPVALNYDAGAEEDNGRCEYHRGCTDPKASNFEPGAVFDDGGCVFIGCTDSRAVNFNPEARHKQSECEYCPCDTQAHYYVKSNNPQCAEPCIKMDRNAVLDERPDCSWCDLLNGAGKTTVEIQVEGVNVNQK
jgi:hypothetical protein